MVNYAAGDSVQAFEKALELAREVNKKGPLGVRFAKAAVNGSLDMSLEEGLLLEGRCYAQVVPTQDRREGLEAFVEKRRPVYKGA